MYLITIKPSCRFHLPNIKRTFFYKYFVLGMRYLFDGQKWCIKRCFSGQPVAWMAISIKFHSLAVENFCVNFISKPFLFCKMWRTNEENYSIWRLFFQWVSLWDEFFVRLFTTMTALLSVVVILWKLERICRPKAADKRSPCSRSRPKTNFPSVGFWSRDCRHI